MEQRQSFYTLKGYQLTEDAALTPALEDYLEMICRLLQKNGTVRIRDLSQSLHVRPSSSSKMVQQLGSLGYIEAERYGRITLTEKGVTAGQYLLFRHRVILRFLCLLHHSDNQLEEAEKIEHFLSPQTVLRLERLSDRLAKERLL